MPEIPGLPEHPRPRGAPERRLVGAALRGFGAALVAADRDGVDYAGLAAAVPLVVDTRGVCARLGLAGPCIVTA